MQLKLNSIIKLLLDEFQRLMLCNDRLYFTDLAFCPSEVRWILSWSMGV